MQNFTIVLTIDGALRLRKGITSGNLVAVNIKVQKCKFPDFVFGKGPTQLIKILSMGSPSTEIGFNRAGYQPTDTHDKNCRV